jgi:hypothetical protein
MANEMITQLPTVVNAQLSDILYAVTGYSSPSSPGTSVQETIQQLLSLIVAGSNISTSFVGGNLMIAATGLAGIGWNHITGTSVSMSANAGYVFDNSGLVTGTLPSTAAFGSIIYLQGLGAGGWKIIQNIGQSIVISPSSATTTSSGYIASTGQYDAAALVCVVANTTFALMNMQSAGLTIV